METTRSRPFRKLYRSGAVLVLLVAATAVSAIAQPIIEGEDIVNASEELRDILYERHELQQRLKRIDRERKELLAKLNHIEQLVQQQKELDAVRQQIAAAEESDKESEIEQLERRADQLERAIEHQRDMHEFEERISEARHALMRLREENDDPNARSVIERLTKDIAAMKNLAELSTRLLKAQQDGGPDSVIHEIEEQIEKRNIEIEDHEELVNLVFEIFEAMEDENEEAVDELLSEIRELLGETDDDQDDPSNAKTPAVIDPLHLPIPVTEEALARFESLDFDETVAPLLRAHCIDCHGNDSTSGELNIEQMLAQRPLVINRDKWINVIEQAKNRVMPPEDEEQPTEEARATIVLATHHAIYNFDYSVVRDPGFESARRLTHAEYDNTVRDLFGAELKMAQHFPSDLSGTSGFDNSANTLFIQPLLMERYMGAADHIVASLLPEQAKSAEQERAYSNVFFEQPARTEDEYRTATKLLGRFVERAYRRPLLERESNGLTKSYAAARTQQLDHEAAIKSILRTTLISPNFLLKSESRPNTDSEHRIDDWELATRLSYFIWGSMPDTELFKLASTGKLHDPDVLTKQVDRMIDDSRSETLGTLFAAQWLGSQHLGTRMRLDPIDNPWCTESLMAAMRTETSMFFNSLVRDDEPIERLIDADFTFLNSELAKLYKISGVRGDEMRRVKLDTDRRGGILGQGSLLAVTSFPYRTSPVVRGKWVLDTVLGTPPPPPPPNVSEFADDIAEKRRLTIKQKLELHRAAPNCYACHSEMDPLGLSLENYDWFGRWRDKYGRSRIDNKGTLPNGTKFKGLAGLKKVIVEQRSEDLVRQVTTKMLSYALGRQLEYYDEPAIREIIAKVGENENRFRSLIHHIVRSYPFQYKKNRSDSLAQGE